MWSAVQIATKADQEVIDCASELKIKVENKIKTLSVNDAIEEVLQCVRLVNKYLEHQAPWKVAKTDLARAGTILYTATEALRISAVHLAPVMPFKVKAVLEVLDAVGTGPAWGQLKVGTKLKTHEALFPRLEIAKQ